MDSVLFFKGLLGEKLQEWLCTEQASQGSGHSPKLLEFQEHLDTALRHRV